jgi:hypothetical protein
MEKNWPLYMTRSTAARYCRVSDREFALAIGRGEIAPIPSDGPGLGALYRRCDLDEFNEARLERAS